MRDVMKHLGSVHDRDSLDDLIELSTCGQRVEIRGGLALLDERVVTGAVRETDPVMANEIMRWPAGFARVEERSLRRRSSEK